MTTRRPRHHIRLAHRGEHLATTRYVVLPSGVVMLAGTYTVARVARETAISEALALKARRARALDDAHNRLAYYRYMVKTGVPGASTSAAAAAARDVARLEALPAVKVPQPYPAAAVFSPPLVRDRRTARQQPAGPAGTREARKRPLVTLGSEAGRSLLAAADRCARRERAQAGRRRA